MCIYYENREGLTYTSQEHVLPAGLGCHTKLPKGMVSDQANEYFSPIERRILQKSLTQIPRIIKGPGKRGSLSPKKATTSDVSEIVLDGEKGLGYMKGVEGYILNSFIVRMENGEYKVQYDTGSLKNYNLDTVEYNSLITSDMNSLLAKLRNGWADYYTYVHIDDDATFVTYFNDKVYVGSREVPSCDDIIQLKELFKQDYGVGKSKIREGQLGIKIDIKEDFVDAAKIASKSAINTLAFLIDNGIQDHLEEIKDLKRAIFSDDDSILRFVSDIPDARKLKQSLYLSDDEQACLITKTDHRIEAFVFFYDYCRKIMVSADSSIDIGIMNGIVCDWKKQTDYTYQEFLIKKGVLY